MIFQHNQDQLNLQINLQSAEIEFLAEKRTDLEVEIPDLRKNSLEEFFQIDFNNGILTIIEKESKLLTVKTDWKFVIHFPENMTLDGEISALSGDLSFESSDQPISYNGKVILLSGDFQANHLISEDLKLKSTSGDIGIDDFEGVLSIATSSGDIEIDEFKGVLNIATSSGDVDIEIFDGKLNDNGSSGDINIENFTGELTCNLSSGDISIEKALFYDLQLKTASGDIELENVVFENSHDVSIASMSGDMDIHVEEYRSSHNCSCKSMSGDINVSGNYPTDKFSVNSMSQSVQQGFKQGQKVLETVFDNLSDMFKSRKGSEKNTNTNQESPKTNSEARIKILTMLQEGKITVEQAETLLKAIQG